MLPQATQARASRSNQRGYILVPTLFFLAVSTFLVVVLANAASTNLRISQVSNAGPAGAPAREVDLADTSIRATLDKLTTPGDNGVCDAFGINPFGGDKVISSGGIKMMVGCEFTGYTKGPAPNAPIFLDEGQEAIRLVGNSYSSYEGINRKGWEGADPPVPPYGNPWLDALTSTNPMTGETTNIWGNYSGNFSTNGQLVHLGKTPLTVVGGVSAKKVIIPLNTDVNGSSAMQVSGKVTQGEGNPDSLAGPSNFDVGDPSRCGFTEVNDSASPTVTRADVIVKPLVSASPALIQCNNAAAAALTSEDRYLNLGNEWDNERFQSNRRSLIDKDGAAIAKCEDIPGRKEITVAGDRAVIELEGAYGPAETKILNKWFRGCAATWHFVGDTYFDVYDPTLPESDPRRNSLVFDQHESNYVVGGFPGNVDSGLGLPMSAFPNACDRTAPPANEGTRGNTITLSSRTGLRHNSGRVAICGPKQSGNTYHKTAISQVKATDLVDWKPELKPPSLSKPGCNNSDCKAFTQPSNTEIYEAFEPNTSQTGTFESTLVFDLNDLGLVDGHLPIDLANLKLNFKFKEILNLNPQFSSFQARIKFPKPQYRRDGAGRKVDYLICKSRPEPFGDSSILNVGLYLGFNGGSCNYVEKNTIYYNNPEETGPRPAEIPIGDLHSYRGLCNPSDDVTQDQYPSDCKAQLILIFRATKFSNNQEPNQRFGLAINTEDSTQPISLTASTLEGFTLPLAPLSVRWAPREFNTDGTNKPGDALFNVFGSVYMPYNAVEVRWGPRGRATGTPIFNGGIVPKETCNETNKDGCRPAIVAGALASWSTQKDPTEGVWVDDPDVAYVDDELAAWPEDAAGKLLVPDVLARNADGRQLRRNYRLTACVILNDKGTPTTLDDEMLPRSFVDSYTDDTQTGIEISGSKPVVTKSGVINNPDLGQVGRCIRPEDYRY